MAQASASIQVIPPRSKDRPLRVFLDQAFHEYRDKVIEKVLHRQIRKPYMKYREIRVIEDLLIALRPKRCLEWGVGYGTLHFPKLLPEDGEWIAVEHDGNWAGRMLVMDLPAQVRMHHVPPDRRRWTAESGDGTYRDFRNYVGFPEQYGVFDFILVDGRARAACLAKARSLLSPRGVVVLHDSNRASLQDALRSFPNQVAFQDYRRYAGGVWIGSMQRELDGLIDLAKHGRIWKIYNALGRRFHL
jgi:predicted O-methyltransferase YrrM